jgi:phage terminase large subunit-like protein
VALSTAGEPDSEFEDMRERIRGQADHREYLGAHRSHLRAEGQKLVYHEWMVRDQEQARDLAVVKEANPLEHITEEYLAEKLASLTLDYGTDWLRLTCNIPTRSSEAAVPEADWDACYSELRIPEGVPIAIGGDFAWLEDTTAIVPLWMKSRSERVFGTPAILQPPGDGMMLDVAEVKAAILEIAERNPIDLAVLDPSKAQDIVQWLSAELGCTVVPRPQTNEFAVDDYNLWMQAVRERTICHDGDPTFRRHVLSAIRARLPGDRYRFDRPRTLRKARRDQRRIVIDALTAASMVHAAVMNQPKPSVYRTRGVIVVEGEAA